MFNGCGCACSGISIAQDLAYQRQRTLCACHIGCHNAHHGNGNETALAGCLDECDDDKEACNDGCVPDFSAANATVTACHEGCADSYAGCLSGCESDQAACEAPCASITDPDTQAACYAGCIASEFLCRQDCGQPAGACNYSCDTDYLATTGPLAAAAIGCDAACCNGDETKYSPCIAACSETSYSQTVAAQLAFRLCAVGNIIGGPTPVLGDNSACDNSATFFDIADDEAKCIYDCEIALVQDTGVCGSTFTPCRGKCEDDYKRARTACASSDPGDDSPCARTARNTRLACLIECCFDERGYDPVSMPRKACFITNADCTGDGINGCASLGEIAGDLCQDASAICAAGPSAECTSAQEACDDANADYAACVDDAVTGCSDAYAECYNAIAPDPRATWCGVCADGLL